MADEAVVIVKLDESAAGGTTARDADDRVPRGPRAPRADKIDDEFLDIAKKLRGTLGGIFGSLAGAVLDLVAALHKLPPVLEKVVSLPMPEVVPHALPLSMTEAMSAAAAPGGVPKAVALPSSRPAPPPGPPISFPTPVPTPVAPPPPPPGAPFTPPTPPPFAVPPVEPPAAPAPAAPAPAAPAPATPAPAAPAPVTTAPAAAAGGGMGLPAGVAGAAGVVAGIVAVASVIRTAFVGAAEAAGRFANTLVSPDANPARFVKGMGDAVKSLTDSVPIINIWGGAIGAATTALAEFMQAMDGMIDRFAAWSPELLTAQVQADLTQMFNDMRRAEEVTPDLIAYLKERTALQQHYEDAKMQFIHRMMPVAIRGMELSEKMLPLIEAVLNVLIGMAKKILPDIDEKVDAIRKEMNKETIDQEPDWWPTKIIMNQQAPNFEQAMGDIRAPRVRGEGPGRP